MPGMPGSPMPGMPGPMISGAMSPHAGDPSRMSVPSGYPSPPGTQSYQPQPSARPGRVPRPSSGVLDRNGAVGAQSPRAADSGSNPALAQLQAAISAKEKEIRDLRRQNDQVAAQYDRQIKEVRDALVAKTQQAARLEARARSGVPMALEDEPKRRALPAPRPQVPRKSGPVFAPAMGVPSAPHMPVKGCEIDQKLADIYNQTASSIPFKRINKGCYLFGTLQVDVQIINHKLMVRSDDGWNRGNFGPVEKFIHANEHSELTKITS